MTFVNNFSSSNDASDMSGLAAKQMVTCISINTIAVIYQPLPASEHENVKH